MNNKKIINLMEQVAPTNNCDCCAYYDSNGGLSITWGFLLGETMHHEWKMITSQHIKRFGDDKEKLNGYILELISLAKKSMIETVNFYNKLNER